jgi:serine/threonine protein kinase
MTSMQGRTLADRYELSERIGAGGMGTVWRARDTLLGRDVAVKILHEGLASDAAFAERFRREARAAARLGHPNIAAVYDTGEHEGMPFIVMELVDGESLHTRIKRDGPLSVRDTVGITRPVLAALGHAHARGLVHRDMKPGNVLISQSGDIKVVDFGIAKGVGEGTSVTRTGALMGTAAYLSPEQVEGHQATLQSDLYALGCLMFAALTGAPPYEGDSAVAVAMRHLRDPVPSVRARRPDVPVALERVLARSLEKDPARRYASAAEMDAALRKIAPGTLPDTAPTVVMAAAGATTAVAGTEVITQQRQRSRPGAPRTGRVLGILAALMFAAAGIWLLVAYMSNRPGTLDTPLPTESATPSLAPSATAPPTPSPTPSPTQTTQAPPIDLPGLKLGTPDNTPTPDEATPSPTPSPTFGLPDTTPPEPT